MSCLVSEEFRRPHDFSGHSLISLKLNIHCQPISKNTVSRNNLNSKFNWNVSFSLPSPHQAWSWNRGKGVCSNSFTSHQLYTHLSKLDLHGFRYIRAWKVGRKDRKKEQEHCYLRMPSWTGPVVSLNLQALSPFNHWCQWEFHHLLVELNTSWWNTFSFWLNVP